MPEPSRPCLLLLVALISGCTSLQAGTSTSPTPSTPPSSEAAVATPAPTATSTIAPTATPDPALLELDAIGCEGGVVLDWSASTHPDFHHYTALRSPESEIKPHYPPIAPAVDWGDSYATDRFVTSAVDASIIPSDTTWHYRVMAYDAGGRVVAVSPVRSAQLRPVLKLGELRAEPVRDGFTRLRWDAYDGSSSCFSSYRVLYGTRGTPSTLLSVISGPDAPRLETAGLHAGTTYQLRVEAVRDTTLGRFVVGETEVLIYAVP